MLAVAAAARQWGTPPLAGSMQTCSRRMQTQLRPPRARAHGLLPLHTNGDAIMICSYIPGIKQVMLKGIL